jgi:cytochrome c oxidase assembly protein subunit 15
MGENMFTYPVAKWWHARGYWADGVFWEHSHRIVASIVGMLTLIWAVWLAAVDRRAWVMIFGIAALLMIVLQGVLGGLTVLFGLPTGVSVAHGVVGQAFLAVAVVLAYSQSREYHDRVASGTDATGCRVAPWAFGVLALVFGQLVLGAFMRHTASGLAVPDFPTMGGRLLPMLNDEMLRAVNQMRAGLDTPNGVPLPPVAMGQVHAHLAHRVAALFVVFGVGGLTLQTYRRERDRRDLIRTVLVIDGLVAVQFTLGAMTVWTVRTPFITTLHVAFGAVLLALCVLLVLRSLPVYGLGDEGEAVRMPTEVVSA